MIKNSEEQLLSQEIKELKALNNSLIENNLKLECENHELKQQLADSQLILHRREKNERGAGRKKIVSVEVKEKIYKLYEAAWTMDELAKKFGLSKGTIFNVIHEPE